MDGLYGTEAGRKTLHEWLANFRRSESTGGVSDMTHIREFALHHTDLVLDLKTVLNQTTYNVTFSQGAYFGFEEEYSEITKGPVLKIYWDNDQPYVLHTQTGERIRMVTLHFQGNTKPYMFQLVRPQQAAYESELKKYLFRYKAQRGIAKVKGMLGLK
jgi:hypothetical protein